MWRSNPVWDLKNNQTHFHSLSPHPTRSCKGPCSRALLPQIPHLIAFYRSCPIRCLMFILFPTLSPEPFCQSQSEKCTSFFSALKLHPDPKNRERIVFILCETVLSKKKTPFARVFMRSHETGYLLACCHFSCKTTWGHLCSCWGFKYFECIVDRLQQREASLPKDRKTVCALNKIMSLFILEDRQ